MIVGGSKNEGKTFLRRISASRRTMGRNLFDVPIFKSDGGNWAKGRHCSSITRGEGDTWKLMNSFFQMPLGGSSDRVRSITRT